MGRHFLDLDPGLVRTQDYALCPRAVADVLAAGAMGSSTATPVQARPSPWRMRWRPVASAGNLGRLPAHGVNALGAELLSARWWVHVPARSQANSRQIRLD